MSEERADPDVVESGFAEEAVTVGGALVHVLRGGAGPPLVYLHGGGAAGLWRRFHAQLAERFEVHAPDHPGFGASEERADVADVAGLGRHYVELLDRLGLERPAVVGASFGGRIACELALRAPDRIGPLVLLAPVGLELPEHPVTPLFPRQRDEALAMLFHDPALARRFSTGAELGCVLGTERDQAALARFMADPPGDLAPRLAEIASPTLLVWGESDRVVPAAHGERFAELMPHARLETIAACGHGSLFEAPEAVSVPIVEFVESQQGGDP